MAKKRERISRPSASPPEADSMERYHGAFSAYLDSSTQLSANSQRAYRIQSRLLVEYLGKRGATRLSQVEAQDLLEWIRESQVSGQARRSVQLRAQAMVRFLRYLVDFEESAATERLLRAARQIQVPRDLLEKRTPFVLPPDTLERLLRHDPHHPRIRVRNAAVLHLLWSAGLRREQISTLRLEGLRLQDRMATIVGKGNKVRVVVFDVQCRDALGRWLEERKGWIDGDFPLVFCTVGGRPFTSQEVANTVKKLAAAAGIKLWPHLFRHTRITELLDHGMPIQAVAALVGHSQIATTQRYYHGRETVLRDAYDQAMGVAPQKPRGRGRRQGRQEKGKTPNESSPL